MADACKHSFFGMCKACGETKAYMVFRFCKEKCLKCKQCGYFWGPGHQLEGQRPYWITEGNNSGD